jgi:hypothetical protein
MGEASDENKKPRPRSNGFRGKGARSTSSSDPRVEASCSRGQSHSSHCATSADSERRYHRLPKPIKYANEQGYANRRDGKFLSNSRRKKPAARVESVTRDSLFCPLCVEKFEELELRFYPCPCGYRVCTMCVHLIKEKAEGKCPNCRELYTEERQRVSSAMEKGIARVLRQTTAEDEREARKAAERTSQEVFHNRTKICKKQNHNILSDQDLDRILAAHKASKTSTQSTKESSPINTPAPEIKLTRFSGGLSVWD